MEPKHGYKKIFWAALTTAGGVSGGQQALQFAWDQIGRVLLYLGLPLETMADSRAANIFSLVALVVFWWVGEDTDNRKHIELEVLRRLEAIREEERGRRTPYTEPVTEEKVNA